MDLVEKLLFSKMNEWHTASCTVDLSEAGAADFQE